MEKQNAAEVVRKVIGCLLELTVGRGTHAFSDESNSSMVMERRLW